MQTINTFASECKLHSPILNLFIQKMSACPSLWSWGKRQLLKQHEHIGDSELLCLKSFTSTEYLRYGQWNVRKLFSDSPSTGVSVKDTKNHFHARDNRLRMIFNLEMKIGPKGKKSRGKCEHVTKETPRKGWGWSLSSKREVSTPCNLQGSTKTQPDSKPQGTGRDFLNLEMTGE